MKSEKWYAAMRAKRGKGTNRNQFTKAKDEGLTIPDAWNKGLPGTFLGKKHSDATKKHMSEVRVKYLRENPHMVPYRLNHHSRGRSYAEEYWKVVLDSNDVQYEEEYRVGPYQLDFAFPKLMVDLEIDGDQHHLDPRIVKSDARRTQYLNDLGWKTIRVKWSEYQKLSDRRQFVRDLLKKIGCIAV